MALLPAHGLCDESGDGMLAVPLMPTAVDMAIELMLSELERAKRQYPNWHSGHEGYAVIKEELDELWADVKATKGVNQSAHCGAEAIQVAAMALRFALDLCDISDVMAFMEGKHARRTE